MRLHAAQSDDGLFGRFDERLTGTRPMPMTSSLLRKAHAAAFLLALCTSSGFAQPAAQSDPSSPRRQAGSGGVVTVDGSVTLTGERALSFTSEAGLLAVSGEDASNAAIGAAPDIAGGDAVARMSYVAYFAHAGAPAHRPIIFPAAQARSLCAPPRSENQLVDALEATRSLANIAFRSSTSASRAIADPSNLPNYRMIDKEWLVRIAMRPDPLTGTAPNLGDAVIAPIVPS